jgi:hypothetical protein
LRSFPRWRATAGGACQRSEKGKPKPSPSGFPWHPSFSSLCHAACVEAALPDHAPLEQLVVLTNLESLNSVLIRQGLPQPERLATLNDIANTQMRTLLAASSVKRLK